MTHSESKNRDEKRFIGTPASDGVGIGLAWQMPNSGTDVKPKKISENEVKQEVFLANQAFTFVLETFNRLKEAAPEGSAKNIIAAQIEVLNDPVLKNKIELAITENLFSAAYAIYYTMDEYVGRLRDSGVAWASERTVDLLSIRDQLVDAIIKTEREQRDLSGTIVFADEISPADMIRFSNSDIAGIVMRKGGLTSHAVILAQSLNIPCVVGVNWHDKRLSNNQNVMMDGSTGEVLFSADREDREKFLKQKSRYENELADSLRWVSHENRTTCGSPFVIRANIEFLNEIPRIKTHGASGIGLLRTETVLFQSDNFDVNSQIEFYRQMLEAADNEPVTIRLFDAGGDKVVDEFEEESNPFLGWRGVRMLLDKPELAEQQIEAILRVSGKYIGKVKILVPMISQIEEVRKVKAIIRKVEKRLKKSGTIYDHNIPLGVMVEVPSIVMMAESVAKEVDFFSIGTNDLTQYTLAVDRGNEHISDLYQPMHPAIWRMIKMTKAGADRAGIPVTVCGEMASKPEMAAAFIGMGITELSMTTHSIPKVKALLCRKSKRDLEQLALSILEATTILEVKNTVEKWSEV